MVFLSHIAFIIRRRRLELSLSQQDLSEMSEVALRTVNALENGKASINLKNLMAIAEVLGLELHLELKKMIAGNETDL
jgi:y4mF family transcriptional regulator